MSAGHVLATGEHRARGNPTHPARQKASVAGKASERERRLRERIDLLTDRLEKAEIELGVKRTECRHLRRKVLVLTRSRNRWRALVYDHEKKLAQARRKRS